MVKYAKTCRICHHIRTKARHERETDCDERETDCEGDVIPRPQVNKVKHKNFEVHWNKYDVSRIAFYPALA